MKRNKLGFTLIELTIVIAMTGMIATIMIASYRNGEKLKRVQLSADAATGLLRLGQEYTLGGKQIPSNATAIGVSPACPVNKSIDHYLFSANEVVRSYGLYAYDTCGAVFLIDYYIFPQHIRLRPGSVKVTTCSGGSCVTNAALPFDIKFTPPFATVTADQTNGSGSPFVKFQTAEFIVESTDGNYSRTLVVDGISGRVEVR